MNLGKLKLWQRMLAAFTISIAIIMTIATLVSTRLTKAAIADNVQPLQEVFASLGSGSVFAGLVLEEPSEVEAGLAQFIEQGLFSYLMVTDKSGNEVYAYRAEGLAPISPEHVADPDAWVDESFTTIEVMNGEDVIGELAIGISLTAQAASLARTRNVQVGLGVAAVLMLSILTALIARAVSRPVAKLADAARSVAEGDLEVEVDIYRSDEIGELADAFRHMIAQLTESSVALRTEKTAAETAASEAHQTAQTAEAERQNLAESVDIMLQSMARFADGDLTVRLPDDADGKIGELFRGFNQTVANLRGVLEGIQQNALTVASASSRIRSASETMAAAAEGTSKRVDDVSTASERAGANVRSVSAAAEEMSTSISEITNTLQRALRMAQNGTQQAQAAVALVNELATGAQEIGAVVGVIATITEQTNLLALNATIEAARAGEAGRGFAVVAAEVKALASETASAAESIDQKISGVQQQTTGAVDSINEIDNVISQIHAITDELAAAMEQQSMSTQEIARNVTEAARGTEEVSENMGEVAQAASQAASGASETLEASLELAIVADQLQEVAGRFKV